MIRFPQEETGANRKLSRPWHGPYRIESISPTGVVAVKIYFPQEGSIQVHTQRVTKCPPNFPSGYYWCRNRRKGPGRPPKWLDRMMSCSDPARDVDITDNANADIGTNEDAEPSNSIDTGEEEEATDVPESVPTPPSLARVRTQIVIPLKCFM